MKLADFINYHCEEYPENSLESFYCDNEKKKFILRDSERPDEYLKFFKYSQITDSCTLRTYEGEFYRIDDPYDYSWIEIIPA